MKNGNASCWPIVMREMRIEARKPVNRWLRFLAAAVAVAIYSLTILGSGSSSFKLGAELFQTLNATLLALIFLLAPLLTADCISSERREGTLGLLFLTPLSPWQIVLGKSLLHGLRAATVFMAIVPLLAFPLLLGGVSGMEFAMAILIDSSAMFLAVAAGIIASCSCRKMMSALFWAEYLSLCFALILFTSNLAIFGAIVSTSGVNGFISNMKDCLRDFAMSHRGRSFAEALFQLFAFNAGLSFPFGWAGMWSSFTPIQRSSWFIGTGGMLVISATVLASGMFYAARRMRLVWREPPPSPKVEKLRKTFCTPIFWKKAFHKEMSRLLDRNPMGWVQRHSWNSRLSGWSWCLAFVFLETFFLAGDLLLQDLHYGQLLLLHVLFMGLAFNAAGSFQRERDSGLMELILITPLSVSQIINGRLKGVLAQFAPAAFVLCLVACFTMEFGCLFYEIAFYFGDVHSPAIRYSPLLFLSASFFTVPIAGLYFSQLRIHFIAAWVAAMFFGFAIPLFIGVLLVSKGGFGNGFMVLFQIILGAEFWWLLHRNLSRRNFATQGKWS